MPVLKTRAVKGELQQHRVMVEFPKGTPGFDQCDWLIKHGYSLAGGLTEDIERLVEEYYEMAQDSVKSPAK